MGEADDEEEEGEGVREKGLEVDDAKNEGNGVAVVELINLVV